MSESTTEPTDLVPIAELDALDRTYCKRAELDAGRVSRAVIDNRRRGAEGRELLRMRQAGEGLNVRATFDRPGQQHVLTTEIAATVDPAKHRSRT